MREYETENWTRHPQQLSDGHCLPGPFFPLKYDPFTISLFYITDLLKA